MRNRPYLPQNFNRPYLPQKLINFSKSKLRSSRVTAQSKIAPAGVATGITQGAHLWRNFNRPYLPQNASPGAATKARGFFAASSFDLRKCVFLSKNQQIFKKQVAFFASYSAIENRAGRCGNWNY